jgi:hypothetical protein
MSQPSRELIRFVVIKTRDFVLFVLYAGYDGVMRNDHAILYFLLHKSTKFLIN